MVPLRRLFKLPVQLLAFLLKSKSNVNLKRKRMKPLLLELMWSCWITSLEKAWRPLLRVSNSDGHKKVLTTFWLKAVVASLMRPAQTTFVTVSVFPNTPSHYLPSNKYLLIRCIRHRYSKHEHHYTGSWSCWLFSQNCTSKKVKEKCFFTGIVIDIFVLWFYLQIEE